jgi:chorismate synthase
MAGNTFGELLRVTTFGESHGIGLGAIVDGCPSGILMNEEIIQKELDRRRPGQSRVTTGRQEKDTVQILSGVFEGKTLGSPIAMVVFNKDQKSKDYNKIKNIYRPGHADYTWDLKFGFRDWRGGGRSSGRETIGRVMGGAIAKQLIKVWAAIEVYAYAQQIGNVAGEDVDLKTIEDNIVRAADPKKAKEMEMLILKAKEDGDSLGGIVNIVVKNMPGGLGEPVFDKINADLGKALFSIPTVKAVEFGAGKNASTMRGSEHNMVQGVGTQTESLYKHKSGGGISGGISTGEDITISVTVKAPSSILKAQKTVDSSGKEARIKVHGRHDPCIIPRFIPVAESMVTIVLADHLLRYRAIKSQS